jgi:allophanate hydrolase subunit 2
MIEIVKAPPFSTVQDQGWRTGRAVGLPRSGAMHPALLEAANRLVGNSPESAGIEWALGPGTMRFLDAATMTVLRDADVRVEGELQSPGAIRVAAGATVEIAPRGHDRFLYLAVQGGIDVPLVLGSRSTYLPGAFGGHEGRRLRTGDRLPIGAAPAPGRPSVAADHGLSDRAGPLLLRVTRGPQWERFAPAAHNTLFAGEYTVAPASDRMGYRLTGRR